MPTVREIEQSLFELAPREGAMSWDNVGQLLGDPEKEGGAPVVSVLPVDAAGNPLPNAEPIRLVEKDTIRYNPYSSPSEPPNHDYQAPMLNGAGGGMGGMGMGGQR